MINILMKTSKGDIAIELDDNKAPVTVENFLAYSRDGFYNGTIFHRVIPGFVVQGGGHLPGLEEKETKTPIKNEADNKLSNLRGTIAMARTQVVDSATSQFYFNLKDNTMLDHKNKTSEGFGYCVFGKITDGLAIIDEIAGAKTGTKGFYRDVPEEDIMIESVEILE